MMGTKITILGSCRHSPYEILAKPDKLNSILYERDHERAYKEACKIFYPAIDQSNIIIVWAPDGVGKHTAMDMKYAKQKGKRVVIIYSDRVCDLQGASS